MFRKIVSSLPFSPALVGQLGFYVRELRKEQLMRRLGLVFIVLTAIVQAFAMLEPPQALSARSVDAGTSNASSPSIIRAKSARNLTQGLADATTKPAQPGDRIEYTLRTTNNSTDPIAIDTNENLADVLEYATLIQDGGGTLDTTTQTLHWDSIVLQPGQSYSRRLAVQLFDTIPGTPIASNNPLSYDCKLTNSYGNAVTVPIECPPSKIIENTVRALPPVNQTANISFSTLLVLLAFILYVRTVQFAKEIKLIRHELSGGTI